MTSPLSHENLANYRMFLERVDRLCGKITSEFAGEILCKAGCSACCRHLSLFPVEAANLATAIAKLPPETRNLLAERIDWPEQDSCPLLLDDRCLVYRERPVICRTHGLPLLTDTEEGKSVDFCRENFRGITSLSGDMVIDLDTLNLTLAAINARFESDTPGTSFSNKRSSIAEIIQIAASSGKEPQ